MRTALLTLVAIAMLASFGTAQIRINEVGAGAVDYVEYTNFGTTTLTLTGYQVWFGTSNYFGYGVPSSAILAPGQSMIWTDASGSGLPALAAGTPAYQFTSQTLAWSPGSPGSCSILDNTGVGLDYFAFGNPNPEKALKSNSGMTATIWNSPAAPKWGVESGINTGDVFLRHSLIDTDSADDWSMTTAANWSPSYLNNFESTTDADMLPPVASFSADVTSGPTPLLVKFSNTSQGDCSLSTLTWDFDVTANPGISTSTLFNDSFVFANPPGTTPGSVVNYDVQLTIVDSCGGMSVSPITTIMVSEPLVAIPQNYVYTEEFEGATDPDTGTAMSALNGWEVNRSNSNAQVVTVDPRTVGAPGGYVDATQSQPTVAILDSVGPALSSMQEIVLHVDAENMFLLNGGAGFRLVLWAQHSGETAGFNDLICFQDGVTTGDSVDSQGNVNTGIPGLDGFKEYLVADIITDIGPANTWTRLEYNFDANFFINAGLAVPNGIGLANNCRIVIRHESNGTYAGGEGLLVDHVRILDQTMISAGSGGIPGFAIMDISNATNLNDHFVGYVGDENGPHYATVPTQGLMDISIAGEVNQPIIMLSGPLNILAADYTSLDPNIGQFDIGGSFNTMTGLPNGLVVLADGTGTQAPPTLFNLIWNTGITGTFSLAVALPPVIPSGFQIPMQAVVLRTGGASISNAVVLVTQ
ncbi:MAG: hypothetical protein H6807_17065 [Planctomycetes bacterium]|nr:hypothetical protein [Planctomycetota bacterium]